MKKRILAILVILISVSTLFMSCEKETVTPPKPPVQTTFCWTCIQTIKYHDFDSHSYENDYYIYENGSLHLYSGPQTETNTLNYCGTQEGLNAFKSNYENNWDFSMDMCPGTSVEKRIRCTKN